MITCYRGHLDRINNVIIIQGYGCAAARRYGTIICGEGCPTPTVFSRSTGVLGAGLGCSE
jgi:hypothetical protein